jgi:hypothetical protein
VGVPWQERCSAGTATAKADLESTIHADPPSGYPPAGIDAERPVVTVAVFAVIPGEEVIISDNAEVDGETRARGVRRSKAPAG